jgi:hypothetical protein
MTMFSFPLRAGTATKREGYVQPTSGTSGLTGTGVDVGGVQLVQSGYVTFKAATLVNDLTFILPANSAIQNILVDTLTAYDSATSAGLTVGTASAGTQYMSSVDVKSTGRETQSLSAAQLLAMSNIGSNTSVIVTVTSVGQPTTGNVFVQVLYTPPLA